MYARGKGSDETAHMHRLVGILHAGHSNFWTYEPECNKNLKIDFKLSLLGNFACLFCHLIFFKSNFLEKFFQLYYQIVKFGPNCFQRLSADNTSR